MDFTFSDEEKLFREAMRDFCEKEIEPRAREIEEKGVIPQDLIKKMSELGILGMTCSDKYGAAGASFVMAGIAAEEIARADISCATAVFFLVQAAWGKILDRYGNEELKEDVIPNIVKGKSFLGIATTEPDAGSDLASMRSTAKRVGDKYILNGEKMYISGVREVMEQMELGGGHLTLVKTDPAKGVKGMSFFYVPLRDLKGITPTYIEEWGRRGISTGGFAMQDVEVPASYRVGDENRGFYMAMEGFDYARAIISVVCAGAALRALELGAEYIKERKVFGVPIGKFEGIQFKLAEDYSIMDAIRLLGYRALWMIDRELKGKASRFEVSKMVAEAKMLAPPYAFNVINDALQWFGAFGYSKECPVEMGLRGVRSYMWAEGSNEIMKIIVARELLGKEFVPTKK